MKKNEEIICINDNIVENFAYGCKARMVDEEDINIKQFRGTVVFRGFLDSVFLKQIVCNKKNFYYIDTGYLGNFKKKIWHRIINNNLHMNRVIKKSGDRLGKLNLGRFPWRKGGRNIVICPITKKSSAFYNIDSEKWLDHTISEIRRHSDRPIIIRHKPETRRERVKHNTLKDLLSKDIHCLVTYNSISAAEAVFYGIPAFTLGENAASMVSGKDLSKIESPVYPEREMWLRNLAYSQFTCEEMRDGTAINILRKLYG